MVGSSFVPTAGFAALSGLVISCAVNLVAFGAHKREATPQALEQSLWNWQKTLIMLYIVGNLAGVGLFLLAESFGAVAVAMPSETAVLLLSNLAFQHFLKIKTIDGSCLKGTLVLCAATACLKDVGPLEADAESMNVFSRILAPMSMLWLTFSLLLGAVSLFFIHRPQKKIDKPPNVSEQSFKEHLIAPTESSTADSEFVITIAYATLVAVATAAGACVGKMLSQADGLLFYECGFAYGVLGFFSFYYGAKSAEECDQSQYLPINECIKLALTAVTGLIVWGDQIQYPVTYFMVYVLLCLGASFCAESDAATPKANEENRKSQKELGKHFSNSLP